MKETADSTTKFKVVSILEANHVMWLAWQKGKKSVKKQDAKHFPGKRKQIEKFQILPLCENEQCIGLVSML